MDWKKPQTSTSMQTSAWGKLVEMSLPFLKTEIASNREMDFNQIRKELESWSDLAKPTVSNAETICRRDQYQMILGLLWCAEQVCQLIQRDIVEPETWNSIDSLCHVLNVGKRDAIEGRSAWALDVIGELLPPQRLFYRGPAVRRSLEVFVALGHDDLLSAPGVVVKLHLDLLTPGSEQVFRHAADSVGTYAHPDFEEAMHNAWEAARKLAAASDDQSTFDGRWRLLNMDGTPAIEVKGDSAGGAAALGWYHLRRETWPDSGIIVLAAIDANGNLHKVGEIMEKVGAIHEYNLHTNDWAKQIDTIVVANTDNYLQAYNKTIQLKATNMIRVCNLEVEQTEANASQK